MAARVHVSWITIYNTSRKNVVRRSSSGEKRVYLIASSIYFKKSLALARFAERAVGFNRVRNFPRVGPALVREKCAPRRIPKEDRRGILADTKAGNSRSRRYHMEGKTWGSGGPRESLGKSTVLSDRAMRFLLIEHAAFISDCYFKCPVQEKRPKTPLQKKKLKESKNIT